MLLASSLKRRSLAAAVAAIVLLALFLPTAAFASDVSLKIPDLNQARFFNNSIGGHTLLSWGIGHLRPGIPLRPRHLPQA